MSDLYRVTAAALALEMAAWRDFDCFTASAAREDLDDAYDLIGAKRS